MKLEEIVGIVAEEVGSGIADEVRSYFGITSILVVVIVLGLGVTLAARAVMAVEGDDAPRVETSAAPAPRPVPPGGYADSAQLADDGWGAAAIAADAGR
ncbi:MAG TPA: hypothetical protein VEB68_12700 [Croceibacterium sp.]|nr:hypothetical protein [Croceibacterium sp.]